MVSAKRCQICGSDHHTAKCPLSREQAAVLSAVYRKMTLTGGVGRISPNGGDKRYACWDENVENLAFPADGDFSPRSNKSKATLHCATPAPSDEYYTPAYALDPLLRYLPKGKVIWDLAWGKGHIARWLRPHGFKVVGNKRINPLLNQYPKEDWDLIVSNTPYSGTNKDDFLNFAYWTGKPFALLFSVEVIGGKFRNLLFREFGGLELLVPSSRVNFLRPDGQPNAGNFFVAWFTRGLNIPPNFTGRFVEVDWKQKKKRRQ